MFNKKTEIWENENNVYIKTKIGYESSKTNDLKKKKLIKIINNFVVYSKELKKEIYLNQKKINEILYINEKVRFENDELSNMNIELKNHSLKKNKEKNLIFLLKKSLKNIFLEIGMKNLKNINLKTHDLKNIILKFSENLKNFNLDFENQLDLKKK